MLHTSVCGSKCTLSKCEPEKRVESGWCECECELRSVQTQHGPACYCINSGKIMRVWIHGYLQWSQWRLIMRGRKMCTGHASVSVKKRWSKVQTQAEKNSTRNYSKYNKICERKGLVTYFYLLIHTLVSLCRGRRHLWIWNCWRLLVRGTVRKCVTVTLFCLSLTKGREYRRISTAEWMCIHSGKYLKQSTGGTVFSWPLSSTSKTLNHTWMSCCLSRNEF